MSPMPQPGALILTFDLGEAAPSLGRAVQGPQEEMAETLVQMLDRRRLRATWAVADPASCDFAARLICNPKGHEIALRADQMWAGHGIGRPRLATELCQRLSRARAIGCTVSTLSLSGVRLDENLDMLVNQGISSLFTGNTVHQRASTTDRRDRGSAVPGRATYLRFGLWQLEPTVRFPSRGDWMLRGAGVRPAVTAHGPVRPGLPVNLVAVDVTALVARGVRGLRLIDRVFRTAAELRDAAGHEIETTREFAQRLARPRQLVPAHSILRGRAA
jgi:hypothetical protein